MFTETPAPYRDWLLCKGDAAPRNHYELLEIPTFSGDPEQIRAAGVRQRQRLCEAEIGPHLAVACRILTELRLAERCLLDSEAKSDYDRRLRGERSTRQRWRVIEQRHSQPMESPPIAAASETVSHARAQQTRVGLAAAIVGLASASFVLATVDAVLIARSF